MDRLEELTVFLAIADTGSLAGAARRLGRSAPTVTRILGDVEKRLGVRLVERSTRRLALTDFGLRLAEHARRLIPDFDDAMRDTIGEGIAPSGRLRLSAPLIFGRRHFAPIIRDFLDTYPDISVEFYLEDRPLDLIEERIDVALRIGHLETSSLIAKRIGALKRIVVASPDYLRRYGKPYSPSDLATHHAILFVNQANGPNWTFQGADGSEHVARMTGRLQVNRAEVAIEAACEGQGLIRILSYQVAAHLKNGTLVHLLEEWEPPPIPVQLVYASARLMPPRVRAFLDYAVPRLSRLPELAKAL